MSVNWYDEHIQSADMKTKIAFAAWVMKHVVDHARDGGSFRYLIYDRLGLDLSAYCALCDDGMIISNEFDLQLKDQLINALKNNDFDKMKSLLGLCDIEGCMKHARAWVPSQVGGSALCSDHFKNTLCGNNDS